MKHIIFIIGNYKNGGVAMHATNFANQLGKYGYKSTIVVTKEIGKHIFFQQKENVELLSLHEYAASHRNLKMELNDERVQNQHIRIMKFARAFVRGDSNLDRRLNDAIRGIRRGGELRSYLIGNKGSILIPFGVSCYNMCYYAKHGLHCKIIYAEKNAAELECPPDPIERRNFFTILSKADGAILQTQNELEFYKRCLRKNAVVIHNPIKEELPEPYQGERRPAIVNFCRISKQKNLELLIASFRLLHKEFPEYSLEIYGNVVESAEERLRDELIQVVRNNREEEYIHILPPTADVHKKIRDCAMFVSSSDFEGLSNSMIEAMAIGLPCICTDCLGGGAREMITDGENGLLVPMGDVDALYKAMRKFVTEPELAEECGSNAAKITEYINAEKIGNQLIELIERV